MVSRRRYKIDIVILIIVLVAGVFAVRDAQKIGDWWHELTYSPPQEIQQLAEDAGMSDTGKQLFYRFSPEVVDKAEIDEHCGPRLGCASGRRIYILRATSPGEQQTAIVTAAHEMLHIVYSRLSAAEKTELEKLLAQELATDQHPNTEAEIFFIRHRGGDYLNEVHSYLGSEEATISAALETHYARYFSDRTKSIKAYRLSPEARS